MFANIALLIDLQTVLKKSQESRFIHLSIPCILNESNPSDSYFLFANQTPFTLSQSLTWVLPQTEMVFLSQCESGTGHQALEYHHLVRTFMQAGASSVLSGLWNTNSPASIQLIQAFYQNREAGDDRATALAKAKRSLIKNQNKKVNTPTHWGNYILFGQP